MKDENKTKDQLINELVELRQRITELETSERRRKRAEEALSRSLEETARGQRLLLALSQAAQAVQRARTPDEVYRAVGDEIARLGYQAVVFTLTDDRAHLAVSHLTFEPALLRAGEKLTGLSAQNYRFPLVPGGFFQRLIAEGETTFVEPSAERMAEALPEPVRPLAGRLAALLGMKQSILAPLRVGGDTHGLLVVSGTGLTEAHVPAVTAFAHQAAIAIENARLYEEAQARSAYLETLLRINATLRSTLPLSQVLETIVQGTAEALGYVGSFITVPDATGERLTLGAVWGGRIVDAFLRVTRFRLESFSVPVKAQENLIARAFVTGELQVSSGEPEGLAMGAEPSISAKMARAIEHIAGARGAACVPLRVAEKTVGVLIIVSSRQQLTDEERAMLLGLADQAGLAIENAQAYERLKTQNLETISALAAAVEAKDPYTSGHSEKVTQFAIAIAEKMGLSHDEIEDLRVAALLHDIGKIGIPDSVLNKPARLTSAEFLMVKAHPVIAAEIVGKIEALAHLVPIIRHHHERHDGQGYPDGLKGKMIPLGARILAVADGFDAMTSDRPYRPAMSKKEALRILQEGAGKQWNAKVVEVLVKIYEEEALKHQAGGL